MSLLQNTIKSSPKVGLPPGSLIHIGEQKSGPCKLTTIDYDKDWMQEKHFIPSQEEYVINLNPKAVNWINVDGLHEVDLIGAIGKQFELHPLLLEDVLNTNHRPKNEDYGKHLFFTLKMIGIGEDYSVVYEQVSLVLGDNWLITFQEQEGDIFESIRERLRMKSGNVRKNQADYLFYRLIDVIVDNYFVVGEVLNEKMDRLEEDVLNSPSMDVFNQLRGLKKEFLFLRKSILPLREAIAAVIKDESPLVHKATMRYLRDVFEHVIQMLDSLDSQREILSGLMDLYHSSVSQKMNQVMQVLTIISTLFIPLTFLAGIYGMNFQVMPELQWKYSYYVLLLVMLVITFIMVRFFKRKGWFG